ncbi:poly [ADP-ribose] polymerase 1-like isoform X2 [Corticium candelabrum]|uniref:poly [ADP-ribose] polymerase 1-like isoform X2 n=1 Tax=Corticium candelabrum TaxID=121492 RepID=UPI002E26E3B4|nr:poly [ADP-ribose] polymerase 1-like isoform X2 [Corticium candelabrum]
MAAILPYRAEYAKSSRSSCRTCQCTITKDTLRIARMVQSYHFDGKIPHWNHCACFFKKYRPNSTADIYGFDSLRWNDQQNIKDHTGEADEVATGSGKKRKKTQTNGGQKKVKEEESGEDISRREQSELLWGIRDKLRESVTTSSLKTLMAHNKQTLYKGGQSNLLAHVSDGMAFGALQPCPECKNGQLKFRNDSEGYNCMGNLTEWTKCMYTTKEPKRKKWVIPAKMRKKNAYLKEFRFKPGQRSFGSSSKPESATAGHSSQAKGFSETAYDAFDGQIERKVRMTLKGNAMVESDSGLESRCHVLERKGDLYSATLGLVDVVKGTNSFYKLQVLESDAGHRCYLYRSWGRVGTEIGGVKVEPMKRALSIDRFKELYAEKTGNSWDNRKTSTKNPGKFYPIELDYGQEDDAVKTAVAGASSSKLPLPVQNLVKKIFDIEAMKRALVQFEIDVKKMPLGKLSRRQIESAFSVLTELQKTLQGDRNPSKILDASNRFYTLIPHDFGIQMPPLLDSEDIIKMKTEMLDNLLDIEIAYSLSKSADNLDEQYKRLKTDIEVLSKDTDEFKMLVEYVANTHAATHNLYTLTVMEIFKVKRQGEAKRYKQFQELGNRMLLWHGSRTSNYAGILSQGLRIAPPEAPVTGYMFGKGVYFADMVTKSANYCHTSVADSVGLMLLCEVALGEMYERTEAEYVKKLPAGKHSTKGVGQTQPDPAAVHKRDDGAVVPMGKAVGTGVNSRLLYNEYIVYDVSQIRMDYLFQMKFNFRR